jgi:hypothetical protein
LAFQRLTRWPSQWSQCTSRFGCYSIHDRSIGRALPTVATRIMTLFIQRAEHRDTQAIHAKLDELLRTSGEADSKLAMLDQREPEEIEAHRDNALP